MNKTGTNYQAAAIGVLGTAARKTLHDTLSLTGAEISINRLEPGKSVPFIHQHKRNEEVYLILSGKGTFHVDGDEFEVTEGSAVRIAPAGKRCLKAADDSHLQYLCVQTQEKSLTQFTAGDGIILETKPSWLA